MSATLAPGAREVVPVRRRVRERLPYMTRLLDAEWPDQNAWESFSALTLIAAVGILCVAAAFSLVDEGLSMAEPLLWAGVLLVTGPITLRLASSRPGVPERVGLVTVLGVLLELVHVLRSPNGFTTYDELL
ncbi:MAG TPA: hypothetical protein VET90_04770, partial [Candidatus Binatus sp.]|nr:hypothetical protein [Candidatus Binatus sp.]